MSVRHLKWVREPDISEYLALGWKQAEQKITRHQIYSSLLVWPFNSEPRFPLHPKKDGGR